MEPYITGPVTPSGDVVLGEAGELHAQVALSFPDEGRATHRWPLSPPQAGPLSGFRNGSQKGLFKGRGPKAALVTKGHCRSIHRMERQGELTRSPHKWLSREMRSFHLSNEDTQPRCAQGHHGELVKSGIEHVSV